MRKIACFFVLTLAACSTTITTVDGNKQVKSLSPSDDEQLCQDIANYVESNLSSEDIARIACGFSSTSSGSCQSDFDKCVSNIHITTTPIVNASDCSGFTASLKNCDATVSQYSTCIEEMVDALATLEPQFPLCSQGRGGAGLVRGRGQLLGRVHPTAHQMRDLVRELDVERR